MPKTSKAVQAAQSGSQPAKPPSHGAPSAPPGYKRLAQATVQRLNKMTQSQVTATPAVANELLASQTYSDDFGRDAPDLNEVVTALGLAAAWTTEATHAEQWAVYADNQRELAADTALELMKSLGTEVEHALGKHPDLADRYPQLVSFVGARRAAGQKAAATKRAKKKAAKVAK